MDYLGMTTTILSHIVAALYMQKQKYNKVVTACFWAAYALFSACIMLFQKNVIYGFFCMLLAQVIVFFITSIGTAGEKIFLFLTYANSFCICIGANLFLSVFLEGSVCLPVYTTGIVILMHMFLYKFLLPGYRKAKMFFCSGWWKLNIILVLFLIQFLNQYAFEVFDKDSASVLAFDFVVFSIIFYSTLVLIFASVKDIAEMNKRAFENDELKNIAYIDGLTKIKNRAAYVKFVKRQMLNHRREETPDYILVMLDIDGFKNINDTKGHAEGDAVLKCVGAVIAKHFSACESFRIGGDEFVILLEHKSVSDVETQIEQMNKELRNVNGITVSYGCSKVDFDTDKPFELAFKKADESMYINKQQKKSITL